MASTLVRQLYSRSVWLADGVDTIWNFAFTGGYIDKTHVKVLIRDLTTGEYESAPINYATDFIGPFQLRILPAVPAGMELTILRDTPKDLPLVDFQNGARISEVSLDTNAKQAVFIASESIDAIMVDLLSSTVDDEWGYKNLKQQPYTGASSLQVIDNGRSHYKTDGSQVTVPNTMPVTFLTTLVNNSDSPMTVSFNACTGILQGSLDVSAHALWELAPRNMLSLTKVADGLWFISGKVARL